MNLEFCDCNCHANENIMHIVACCRNCPGCNAHINTNYYDKHTKNCELFSLYRLYRYKIESGKYNKSFQKFLGKQIKILGKQIKI